MELREVRDVCYMEKAVLRAHIQISVKPTEKTWTNFMLMLTVFGCCYTPKCV